MDGADKDEPDRTEFLHVKMTEEEKRTLRVRAAEKGMSMSECVREALCREEQTVTA